MMSPREEFIKKLRKGLATSAIVLSGAAAMTGCESKNIEPEVQNLGAIGNIEVQTTKAFEDLTKEEKEEAKMIIEQKEILMSKVLDKYQKCYPGKKISESDLEIIKVEALPAWKKKDAYYIDENPDMYSYKEVERTEEDYDLILVDKQYNKILFTVSKIKGKTKETHLNKYYDKERGHNYINGIEYGSIINAEYTKEQCFEAMQSLQKYRENKEYYNNIKRNINMIDEDAMELD